MSGQTDMKVGLLGCFGVFAVVLIIVILSNMGDEKAVTVEKQWAETTIAAFCAHDEDDARLAARAVANSDKEALAGLVARGKIFPVAAGVRLHSIISEDRGLAMVRLESGASIGESCWIPTPFLR